MTPTAAKELKPGTVIVIQRKARFYGHPQRVVVVGHDRGMVQIAEQTQGTYNPFHVDWDDGEHHMLATTHWRPARIYPATILATNEEFEAEIARKAAVKAAHEAAEQEARQAKEDAKRRLANALDQLPGVTAYFYQGEVKITGNPAPINALADLLQEVAAA